MRIVIDLQGAQNESRFRGIGRYSLSLARAIAEQPGPHEIWLALSARFPEGIGDLLAHFDGLIPAERIAVFDVPGPAEARDRANSWRLRAGELIREHFLASLQPDILHVSSLFEGFGDDSVTSVGLAGLGVPTVVTLYDLIPLLRPETYLAGDLARDWYARKAGSARRADMLLAISQSSANEARSALGTAEERLAVIGAGIDAQFRPAPPDPARDARLRQAYGLDSPFLLYTGAADPRKNLQALLRAMALLPEALRGRYVLACVGKLHGTQQEDLSRLATELGLPAASLRFLGYVPDDDLVVLYGLCAVFVFPSLHEGFGLPAAEAMACGAAVIGSNTTSVPEVIGRADALFDPADPADIARHIERVLTDQAFSDDLRAYGTQRAASFTWQAVAQRTIAAYEALHERRIARGQSRIALPAFRPRLALVRPDPGIAPEPGCDPILDLLRAHHDVTQIWVAGAPSSPEPWSRESESHAYRLDAEWLLDHGGEFERLLYVLPGIRGAHPFLPLLQTWPGLVLLTGAGALAAPEPAGEAALTWQNHALYYSHGLAAVLQSQHEGAWFDTAFPSDEPLHRLADGVLVHDAQQIEAARNFYGDAAASRMRVVPEPVSGSQRAGDAAELWKAAIDALYDPRRPFGPALLNAIAAIDEVAAPGDLALAASSIASNLPRCGLPQLLIDVSTIADTDARTGIQRVVRSILSELVAGAPEGWRIEPVRAHGDGYVYARAFSTRFFGLPQGTLPDEEPVETHRGDIFLGLDLAAHEVPRHIPWFDRQRQRGMRTAFVVYDLLPLRWPDRFPADMGPHFRAWADALAEIADGIVCISQAVASEFAAWFAGRQTRRRDAPRLGWFHLGADLQASMPSLGLPEDCEIVLEALQRRPFLLSVGTLEPRKGYTQVLDAFERLWADGFEVGLVIVGQQGWGMEKLASRLAAHSELGSRLFWLRGVSDEMLMRVYGGVAGLLAASEGEGFGLPLIEAAQHGLPILARDLPVFREIAGDRAAYFTAADADDLADAVRGWIEAWAKGCHVASDGMPWLTWRQSAMQLASVVLGDGWQMRIEAAGPLESVAP